MAICQDELYWDVLEYLPKQQTLSEQTIRKINQRVISKVGDSESNYPEILCKCLEANAIKNRIEYNFNTGDVKKEVVDGVEFEYFDKASGKNVWDEFIDSLKDLCPLFGYIKPYVSGIKIVSGKRVKLTDGNSKSSDMSFFIDDQEEESIFYE